MIISKEHSVSIYINTLYNDEERDNFKKVINNANEFYGKLLQTINSQNVESLTPDIYRGMNGNKNSIFLDGDGMMIKFI